MFEFVRKIKNDKRGVIPIDIIVGFFTIIFVWIFIIQLVQLDSGTSYISQASSYIARTIGAQGGICTNVKGPEGWKEGKAYTTSEEMYNELGRGFREAGFKSWTVTITSETEPAGHTLGPFTNIAYAKHTKVLVEIDGEVPALIKTGKDENYMHVHNSRIIYTSFAERKTFAGDMSNEGVI